MAFTSFCKMKNRMKNSEPIMHNSDTTLAFCCLTRIFFLSFNKTVHVKYVCLLDTFSWQRANMSIDRAGAKTGYNRSILVTSGLLRWSIGLIKSLVYMPLSCF